jgi:hypothetical protein
VSQETVQRTNRRLGRPLACTSSETRHIIIRISADGHGILKKLACRAGHFKISNAQTAEREHDAECQRQDCQDHYDRNERAAR